MYDGGSRRVNWKQTAGEKKRAETRFKVFHRSMLSVRLDRSVDDLDLVALVPAGRRALREEALRAVVVAYDDLILLFGLHALLDLISAKTAAERPEHGREILAASGSDLVPEDAAEHGTADRSDSGRLSGLLDHAHVLDHRALAADRGDDHRLGRRGRRHDGHLLRSTRRLGFRNRLRLGLYVMLYRLRRLWLRFGLLCLGDNGARAVLVSDRSRYPAHDGSDSDHAEKADGARGNDDERVGATQCFHGTSLSQASKPTDVDARRASKFV